VVRTEEEEAAFRACCEERAKSKLWNGDGVRAAPIYYLLGEIVVWELPLFIIY
jgi:hypothetical protein